VLIKGRIRKKRCSQRLVLVRPLPRPFTPHFQIPIKRYEVTLKGYTDLAAFYGASKNRQDLSAPFAK